MSSQEDESFEQEVIRCKVKIYKLSTKMQRCPYIHEMKERLLGEQPPPPPPPPAPEGPVNEKKVNWNNPPVIMDQIPYNNQPVATVVKLNPDGYGSHTSPTHHRNDQRTPLMSPDEDGYERYGRMVSTNCFKAGRSNAKTSLFIIMSFVYAKLLIVVCLAYVISDVVTHNIPLWYYEGFFTYLYGMSILFLLYVFCFLLQESTCCSGEKKEQSKKAAAEKSIKEKNKKKEEKEKKKQEKEKQNDKKNDKKDNDKKKKDKKGEKSTYRRNSEGVVDAGLSGVPVPVAEIGAQSEPHVIPQDNIPATNNTDLEVGVAKVMKRKRKTTQSTHGSFFLRVGAIAFGLGTMIYTGLEFGSFFEIPFTSPCYMILRGINPVLQMVFTFMQMYFIFMNSRLNIHRFKVIARFGLMHVVATNICVWIRTVVLEYLKEITVYHKKFNSTTASYPESIRLHNLRNANTILGTHVAVPDSLLSTPTTTLTTPLTSTLKNIITTTVTTAATTLQTFTTSTTPSTTTLIEDMEGIVEDVGNGLNGSELLDNIFPQALAALNGTDTNTSLVQASCGKINIMGTIVQDSAPYLFPFIVEYSLIGAVVIYVMWKHIGRNPKYTEEDLEHRLEVMLTRRAFDLAKAQNGRVDCVGASKGLFFGLLLLVGSLICLILFFVLIHHPDLNLLAIYLADVSHCALMALSIIAIIVGLIRVKALRFRIEEPSNLNDILLRISAFGLFVYATFSVIAGSLNAFTHEPNLLVMVTGILSIVQVVLQLLFIADISRRRVHLPEHARSKPGRQVVTFLLICNITMWIIYTFETQKVEANPIQLEFYGFLAWAIIQRLTLPLCIFHRFHSAVTLAEIWKTSYNARLE